MLRTLIVTNMYPTAENPVRGRFVADQVRALRELDGLEVEVEVLRGDSGSGGSGGDPRRYVRSVGELRRRWRGERFDVVHAHFGLTAWPARLGVRGSVYGVTLHGTDLSHRRSRPITLAALPWLDLIGVVSADLGERVPRAFARGRVQVLPCGVDLDRFRTIDRAQARAELGLTPDARHLLFPADPARPEKRFDLASRVADRLGASLLTLGSVAPDRVPLWINAADAVLVPSDREGFGLATLEALACDVPVLATPHGVAPEALADVPGTLCAPFSVDAWSDAVARILDGSSDPRVPGRAVAERYGAPAMAERVAVAWRRRLRDRAS